MQAHSSVTHVYGMLFQDLLRLWPDGSEEVLAHLSLGLLCLRAREGLVADRVACLLHGLCKGFPVCLRHSCGCIESYARGTICDTAHDGVAHLRRHQSCMV